MPHRDTDQLGENRRHDSHFLNDRTDTHGATATDPTARPKPPVVSDAE
ncbi:hypothetical protein ACFU98_30020 [Streptomyces sp. NPDC057575]